MSLSIKFYWRAAFLLVLLSSCADDEYWTDGDYYHLEHKEAILPIWVRGNIDSGIFLFTIHGGPTTASGHEFSLSPGFKELEKDYAVVYWDQRESGIAQGKPQDHGHTLEQYTEDARFVYKLIQEKYNPASTFLLGHSWGGAIGHSLLLDESFQDQLDGWIFGLIAGNGMPKIPTIQASPNSLTNLLLLLAGIYMTISAIWIQQKLILSSWR